MMTPSAARPSLQASIEAPSSACARPSAPHSLCTSHRPDAAPPGSTIVPRTSASSPALASAATTAVSALEYAGRPAPGCAADYDDPDLPELEHPPKYRR